MKNKSILIFGAGKIGRSFLGQVFGLSGYEVIFSDINLETVQLLNARRSYPVVIKGEKEETLRISNVRAVSGFDETQLTKEISEAGILAISVGKNALEKVIPVIGKGLKLRYQKNPTCSLDIIVAENMRAANDYISEKLLNILPSDYPFDQFVGIVETSIGKMVPIMTHDDLKNDPLVVFAEPYNNLIVDKKGFRGAIPDVKDLSPKENIKAWVDRKLFIHNMGHVVAAYFGAYKNPDAIYIYEVLSDLEVYSFTKEVMLQSANILHTAYPNDFSEEDLKIHIEDLLFRFQNKSLRDTIFRVGQDRIRKLGADDRFVGIIKLAEKTGTPYGKIVKAMAYAFGFQAKDENGERCTSDILFDNYKSKGVEYTLQKVCGFELKKDRQIFEQISKQISYIES